MSTIIVTHAPIDHESSSPGASAPCVTRLLQRRDPDTFRVVRNEGEIAAADANARSHFDRIGNVLHTLDLAVDHGRERRGKRAPFRPSVTAVTLRPIAHKGVTALDCDLATRTMRHSFVKLRGHHDLG